MDGIDRIYRIDRVGRVIGWIEDIDPIAVKSTYGHQCNCVIYTLY